MITGAKIIGALLRDYPTLVAKVPVPNIKPGALPDDAPLPALLIRRTSKIRTNVPLKAGATARRVERISVTVRAENYRDQEDIITMIEAFCTGKTGDIGGGARVSILDAGTGPDLRGPGNSFEATQDFRVSYDA